MTSESFAERPTQKPSFMSANFLGREKGYQNVTGFDDPSVAESFSPVLTYAGRISRLFGEIAAMGFEAVDLWTAHCSPRWATERHLKGLEAASRQHGVKIVSMAGGMGGTLEEFEALCRLSQDIGCPLLGVNGNLLPAFGGPVSELLERYGLFLGFENHPNERTASEVLDRISGGRYPRIGVTLDTGCFAAHDYPILDAIDELKDHLLHVHIKNIEGPGGHVAAAWNEGCLDFEPIVRRLQSMNYNGGISVEYEPLDRNPTESCRQCREQVEAWLTTPEIAQVVGH